MLLSLFKESQESENSSSKEEDNLDGLFDEDDGEDAEGYAEPEENEYVTLENLGTEEQCEHNISKEDLEGEFVKSVDKGLDLKQHIGTLLTNRKEVV